MNSPTLNMSSKSPIPTALATIIKVKTTKVEITPSLNITGSRAD